MAKRLRDSGLQSERLLWPTKGPSRFEEELGVEELERALGLTTLEKAVRWAQTKSMWPDTFGLACCAIEMMSIVSARYDIARFGMEAFRSSPRQADLLIVPGRAARVRARRGRHMTEWHRVPGYVTHRDGPEMPTVTIETGRIREACEHARDELGFDMCVDVVATDYLGWGDKGVSGYIGTASGRDLMHPMTQGLQALPGLKPKRFSLSYHLLALRQGAPRARLQCWLDEGEHVPSVVSVWPTCDWHEREQYDLMGIVFDGHPNLERLLMPDDWEGHPLRKDYPIGGEPVRF